MMSDIDMLSDSEKKELLWFEVFVRVQKHFGHTLSFIKEMWGSMTLTEKRGFYYTYKQMKDIDEHLLQYAKRKTPKDEETGLPKRYVSGLTPAQKKEHVNEIKRVQKVYEETGQVVERKKVGGKSRRSPFVVRFEKLYGFPITDLLKVKKEFPNTDIDTILRKGRGAFASSGSRPNQTPDSWAYARLASVLTGGKAMAVDLSLIGESDKKKILSSKQMMWAILGAMSVCAIHYRFVVKPYLDTQRKELERLKSHNKQKMRMLSEESSFHKIEYIRYKWGRGRRLSYPLGSAYVLSSGMVRRDKGYAFYRLYSYLDTIIERPIFFY